jgi:minimal PKS acyl carrier protein
MSQFTVEQLKRILQDDVGVDESVDLDGDILDVAFADLGYDSLAMLQISLGIQERQGVSIPDDAAMHMKTPRGAIDYVNGLLALA